MIQFKTKENNEMLPLAVPRVNGQITENILTLTARYGKNVGKLERLVSGWESRDVGEVERERRTGFNQSQRVILRTNSHKHLQIERAQNRPQARIERTKLQHKPASNGIHVSLEEIRFVFRKAFWKNNDSTDKYFIDPREMWSTLWVVGIGSSFPRAMTIGSYDCE